MGTLSNAGDGQIFMHGPSFARLRYTKLGVHALEILATSMYEAQVNERLPPQCISLGVTLIVNIMINIKCIVVLGSREEDET